MNFPQLPYAIQKRENEIVQFQGLNFTDNYQNGALEAVKRISTERYPYMAGNMYYRKDIGIEKNVVSVFGSSQFIYVHSNGLYRRENPTATGKKIGSGYTLTDGEKQFAQVHNFVVVFPDKLVINTTNWSVKAMVQTVSVTAKVLNDRLSLGSTANRNKFNIGDVVTVSGSSVSDVNGEKTVIGKAGYSLLFGEEYTIPSGQDYVETDVTVTTKVPDLDFICEYQNRLWGCNSAENTIFCSVQGNPYQLLNFASEYEGSYNVQVSSHGKFTGCCKLGSSVLFFKDDCVHKVLGSFPEEFQVYEYHIKGVRDGCYKSMQTINDILFYVSVDGIYTYNGGSPSCISVPFGDISLDNACAAKSTRYYFLSADRTGTLMYDLKTGLWTRDSETYQFKGSAYYASEKYGGTYTLDTDGDIYRELEPMTDETISTQGGEWELLFKPFYETVTGSFNRSVISFEHKRYRKLIVRTDSEPETIATFSIKYDDGEWEDIKTITGRQNRLETVVIPIARCDKLQLRIAGVGRFTLMNIQREYSFVGAR